MTIAVIGQTRSGTSMTMQMLFAAGLHLPGEYPAFEDPRAMGGISDSPWWERYDAVKFVDAHNGMSCWDEKEFPKRVICLRRDTREQAKSIAKVMRLVVGMPCHYTEMKRSVAVANDWYQRLAEKGNALTLYFEDTLDDPAAAAGQLSEFIGKPAAESMAEVVIDRHPNCYPGLLELEQMQQPVPAQDRP